MIEKKKPDFTPGKGGVKKMPKRSRGMTQSRCPSCGEMVDDSKGLGIPFHDDCGYCAHRVWKPGMDDDHIECQHCDINQLMLKCYKCGKEVTDRITGQSVVGVQFNAYVDSPNDKAEKRYTDIQKKQWGKYVKDAMRSKGISFCFECYIDALMGGVDG